MIFPKVSIIITAWNRKKDCLECLTSIEKLDYPKESLETIVLETIAVDNGSNENIYF